jgi:hypothetical protein
MQIYWISLLDSKMHEESKKDKKIEASIRQPLFLGGWLKEMS